MEEEKELRRVVDEARQEQEGKSPQLRLLSEIRDLLGEQIRLETRTMLAVEAMVRRGI